jgi:hypothetical protein
VLLSLIALLRYIMSLKCDLPILLKKLLCFSIANTNGDANQIQGFKDNGSCYLAIPTLEFRFCFEPSSAA